MAYNEWRQAYYTSNIRYSRLLGILFYSDYRVTKYTFILEHILNIALCGRNGCLIHLFFYLHHRYKI